MSLIEFKNISKKYGPKLALDDISIKFEKGKIYGLLGPNGSGKTTIIKIINDLLNPTSGEVLINGKQPGVESKKVISYLPERTYLNMNIKVKELIAYFKDFYSDFDENKAISLLERLKISLNDKLKTMSKGTKEKVQLVMVMSRNAQIYILDEPIGGVDPASRDFILDVILKNYNKDASVIISTHLISDIEKILDNIIFIKDGKIVLNDTKENVLKDGKESIDQIFREEFKC